METTFSYIRNRIREHRKEDLIDNCYRLLDHYRDEFGPIWFIFLLMKWTYLYGGEKYPLKALTAQKFNVILQNITDFNSEHISNYIKNGRLDIAMHIFYSQQFYLQKIVRKEVFSIQLNLYETLSGKYDIGKSFKEKTGLSIFDFIYIMQIIWLYVNSRKHDDSNLNFEDYLEINFLNVCAELTSDEKISNFLELVVLDPMQSHQKINEYKRNVKVENLQHLETTFFTIYPFQLYNGKVRLVHERVLNHSINYFIYDYLKSNDENFTTEFGNRFEKYIQLGIMESKFSFINENQLKKKLGINSNLIDFYLEDFNVFIECKAIEIQPTPLVNPTDEIIFNSLKESILKAYFKQLLNVSKKINSPKENWGLIITYKELYWSQFNELFEIGKDKFENSIDSHFLPPENVFILDIFSWNTLLQIIKDKKITLIEILEKARFNNSKPETKKQTFSMHLDEYKSKPVTFKFLEKELKKLEITAK